MQTTTTREATVAHSTEWPTTESGLWVFLVSDFISQNSGFLSNDASIMRMQAYPLYYNYREDFKKNINMLKSKHSQVFDVVFVWEHFLVTTFEHT